MNNTFLQDIVKGKYGRKVAYVDLEEITPENVVSVVAENIGIFNTNRYVAEYLWNYKNGDQPILYRRKIVRDDIINKVVENHAYEIVQFSVSQTYGEPIQYVSRSKEESINKAVDRFNDYMHNAFKYQRNVAQGEWKSAVGTSFLAVQKTKAKDLPFRIVVPTPLNTFIIYSSFSGEPLLAVQDLKDSKGQKYYLCFSENKEFKIQNGQLLNYKVEDGTEVKYQLHTFGGIPIVEVPNNQDRLSDIEIVITLLDSINNMQSNRMDSIEQFVQSWIKFVNCEIDEEQFRNMKAMGALVVKSNNGDNKADVEVMSQELNQSESQVAKNDLWGNALSILAIPNKEGNTGGDTQGAVELRNGWDFAKNRAKLKDAYVIEAEKRLAKVVLNILRVYGKDLGITASDFDINIPHSPQDNLVVKCQALQYLLQSGINPLIAIKTSGLWNDSEKTFLMSKPYLDVLYKTIDEKIKEQNLQLEEEKDQELLANLK
jgi:SPP1 family phage portal protein